MLDISGVAHLFGADRLSGEEALIEDCRTRLAAQGFTVAAGVGGNPRAASALARFSQVKIAPDPLSDKAFAKLFHDLPLAALGLDEKTVADMARAGLRRIGDIALRPRAPIAARFGSACIARLDALKGLERASIAPRFAPPDFCAERRFASPVQTFQAIEATLCKLADDLVVLLERQAKGARRIELELHRVDGDVRRIRVGASRPLNEARAIKRLFRERISARRPRRSTPALASISCGSRASSPRMPEPSQSAFERAFEAEQAQALADLIDRLSARLGPSRVTRQRLIDAHLPEQAASPRGRRRRDRRSGDIARRRPRRPGRCACSSGPSRSRLWPRCRTARLCASAGGGAARGGGDRGARAHRRALVARPRGADARLFPRRGR